MSAILAAFLAAGTALFLWNFFGIASNYLVARKIGLPIIICPVDYLNPLWVLIRPTAVPILRRLPFGLGNFTKYSYIGWPWEHQYRLHARYGPAFTVVYPRGCQVILGNTRTAANVLNRWREFTRDDELMAPFGFFGPNVVTSKGDDWQRHRKITTPPFNERNSALVWLESVRQAGELLEHWTTATTSTSTGWGHETKRKGNIRTDIATLGLNVLSGAGFGRQQPFHSKLVTPSPGYEFSFLEAMHTTSANLFKTVIASSVATLPSWMLPKSFVQVAKANLEVRGYVAEMVREEKAAYYANKDKESVSVATESAATTTLPAATSYNLMATLVRAAEQAKLEEEQNQQTQALGDKNVSSSSSQQSRRFGLSDDEIYGNLFLYNLAGHETTAGTLCYGIPLLAIHPDVQSWIREEIQHILGTNTSATSGKNGDIGKPTDINYEEIFPRLKRCLALMYETLRLYGPLYGIPRYTGTATLAVKIDEERTVLLPPKTSIAVNNGATQTDPAVWGDDAHIWRPSRWISSSTSSETKTEEEVTGGLDDEKFLLLEPGTRFKESYLAWSSGPRVCPGMKFSQVEFVAVIMSLFHTHRVEPVVDRGETMTQARARLQDILDDSHMIVTVQMRHPERCRLRWLKVEEE